MASEPARLRLVHGGEAPSAPREGPVEEQLSEPQLVALALENDERALELLYRRHAKFAMNLAVRLQGNGHDIEDLVHDAFLKAFGRLAELRDSAAFRSWLGSIIVRLVKTRLRRRRLLGTLGLALGGEGIDLDAVASSEASPEARAQLAQLYALLNTMPENERIAWTLRYVDSHRLEAVAKLCGCSLATAKRRIAKTQRFLQAHFVSPVAEAAQ